MKKRNIKNITALYFSPTGNCRKVAEFMSYAIADRLNEAGVAKVSDDGNSQLDETQNAAYANSDSESQVTDAAKIKPIYISLNQESARAKSYSFCEEDLVVFVMPTYAGRIPNVLKEFLASAFAGNGTLIVPAVTYGNRDYQCSLLELTTLMERNGFIPIAGGAFIGEHPFSQKLAPGRPDMEDMQVIGKFAEAIADKIIAGDVERFVAEGDFDAIKYYTPLGIDGQPAKFLKACPVQDPMRCTDCGRCYLICPVASKDICIKCMACVKSCHASALKFEDEAFLSHVAYLEENYSNDRKEPDMFIGEERFLV